MASGIALLRLCRHPWLSQFRASLLHSRAFVLVFRCRVCRGCCVPFSIFSFAVFPVQSPLDRRLPWLKWAGLLLGIFTVIPGLRTGDPGFPAVVAHLVGSRNSDLMKLPEIRLTCSRHDLAGAKFIHGRRPSRKRGANHE